MSELNPLHPLLHDSLPLGQTWKNLQGSSLALVLSHLTEQYPVIVITPDSLSAQRLLTDFQFYTSAHALNFPDWETLPYDGFSPHQAIVSERLATLFQLQLLKTGLLVLPITTLMYRLPPKDYVYTHSLLLKQDQILSLDQLRSYLQHSGYRTVSEVIEPGELALRGGLLDIYPMGSLIPYRIDWLDDQVDSIRTFDPETQRSLAKVTSIQLLPAREFPLTSEAITLFRSQWRTEFGRDPTQCPTYQDVSKGIAPAGIEYYLPLFFQHSQTLFDYLPKNSILLTYQSVLEAADQFWKMTQERYELLRHAPDFPILSPTKLFLQTHQIFAAIKNYPHIRLTETTASPHASDQHFTTAPLPPLTLETRHTTTPNCLTEFCHHFPGRILITAETTGRREILLELLRKWQLQPNLVEHWSDFLTHTDRLCLTVSKLEQGFLIPLPDSPVAIITEAQLFGEKIAQRQSTHRATFSDPETIIRNLTELTLGAPVVHEQHGVGRYQGLIKMDLGGEIAEFLQLEYANNDKLYVPVTSLHLINRFTGVDPEQAPLHRLGSGQWEKAKRKAAQQVSDVAAELLDIYSRRAARLGHSCKQETENYQKFAETFPFEETPDQQRAITEVLNDLYSPRPMDRLICGDVGFGKTEVAMRAAFVAVFDGQQVAVLVPTTLLAQQHHQNFQDRFADWPIKIAQISRFNSAKQQKTTLQAIADGQLDIIIGTHKLLQENLQFKNLGLVIIDEEHRFGVKQKERFKALRSEVDVLTLTATPIPRSLNLALANLRDLSLITTPPPGRLAVKTFIKEWQDLTIIEAIRRELNRGGQIYFLHNDIDTIQQQADTLKKLVPEAQINIAHGKMRERQLEKVMQDFYHRRFNLLICTTIIETGIDIPTANTIIIHRADKLGLAQLYQLRGRVGRSHHRAYAYLIVPPQKQMTRDAIKRIAAIGELDDLGMGFTLASQDLEIRGAGELLGSEQSGHFQEIGYTLYTQLLERAVTALKSGQQPELLQPLAKGTEINLYSPALLPNNYLPDVHVRLIIYKRIANATTQQELDNIHIEMIDRFGLLPEAAKTLIKIAELKLKATPLGIQRIDFSEKGGYLLFDKTIDFDPKTIIQLLQQRPHEYRLDSRNHKLHLLLELAEFSKRYQFLETLLERLQKSVDHPKTAVSALH